MKVFISWSGDRSRAVAEALDEWLQCVLQAVDPWMSSKDIDRGALWFNEIHDQLANTTLGIVCLTQENKTKPWILFESGALAKGLNSNRVCTFLIDLQAAEVGSPLGQFNHTTPDKDGVYSLVRTINSSLGEKALKEKVLEQVFETYWPQFDQRFKAALKKHPQTEEAEPRTPESMMEELVMSMRRLDRRVRDFEVARIENDDIRFSPPQMQRRASDLTPRETVAIVERMLDDEAPIEFIIEHLADRGVPLSLIKDIINRVKKSKTTRG